MARPNMETNFLSETTLHRVVEPVFVVGCHRSGTTLLGAMIGGHPEVITIPEAQFVAELIPSDAATHPIQPSAIIDAIEEHWRYKIWRFDLKGKRPEPKGLDGAYADAIRWLVGEYAETHGRQSPRYWVDHQPGHGQYLARLDRHFPKLKVIHIVRDGRAVAASLMPLDWGPNEIHSAAYFWEQRLAWCLGAAAYLGQERVLLIRYEDVLLEPEKSMRRVAEFLGLPFHEDMLHGKGLSVPKFTIQNHQLVGSLPDPARIDDWKTRLTQRQIEIFEAITGDLLRYFGYKLLSGLKPRPISLSEKIGLSLRGQLKAFVNEQRFAKRKQASIREPRS